jgi:DNA-binding LacI/PurR family transcriptional regulator
MKVRLKDVAAKAGVAVNTASTILNRRPNSWASKETEARVFAAAEELGYKPNRAAVGLRSGRFNTLGLLVPDLHNPYYTTFADLLDLEAERRGFDLILETWRTDLKRELHCLEDLSDRQIDGMASFLSDNATHADFLGRQYRKGRAFVALTAAGGAAIQGDAVMVDFTAGLMGAVDALLALGHRSFAFLNALSEGQDDGQRREMVQKFLHERSGGSLRCQFIRCGHSLDSAYGAVKALFRQADPDKPTALIAMNDLTAIAAGRAALEDGLQIPKDFSLVGVDDIPLGRFLPITLSTIGQPIAEMARKTASLLIDRVEKKRPAEQAEQVVFPARFIARESVGPACR